MPTKNEPLVSAISAVEPLAFKFCYDADKACNTINIECADKCEKEKMPSEKSKTWVVRGKYDNKLYAKINDGTGHVGNTVGVMPDIQSLDIIGNNGEKQVVKITFADNTVEKAVLDKNDTFSLEQAVSICIAKKMFSMIVGNGKGSSVYNKIVDRCLKFYKANQKAKADAAKKAAEKKAKYQKLAEKKRNKRIRRENEAREELIEIQKEAYIRALREYHTVPNDCKEC